MKRKGGSQRVSIYEELSRGQEMSLSEHLSRNCGGGSCGGFHHSFVLSVSERVSSPGIAIECLTVLA